MAGASGEQATSQPANAESQKQQQLQSATMQIHQIEQSVTSVGRQFPQAANEVRMAVEAVRALARKIVSSPGQTEPAAPDIL